MDETVQLSLRWNNFQENFTTQFEYLKKEEEFVDVTFCCEGKLVRAHRVVLSASSPYLTAIFKETPCKHPVIILDEIPFTHMEWLLAFIYTGAVHVPKSQLPALLESANILQIRGLSEQVWKNEERKPNRKRARSLDTPEPPFVATKRAAKVENRRQLNLSVDEQPFEEKIKDEPIQETVKNEPLENLERINAQFGLEGDQETVLSPHSNTPVLPEKAEGESLQVYRNYDDPIESRKRHSLDPRICPICKRHYSNLSNLRQHLRLIHNPRLVKCELCSKTFKTDLYLRRHLVGFHYLDQSYISAIRDSSSMPVDTAPH